MASCCKGLDDYAPSVYYLDGPLHRFTPTPVSSVAVSITFDLINLLYSNMYYSIDSVSDDTWKWDISDMGNLSSTIALQKYQLQWLSKNILLFGCL